MAVHQDSSAWLVKNGINLCDIRTVAPAELYAIYGNALFDTLPSSSESEEEEEEEEAEEIADETDNESDVPEKPSEENRDVTAEEESRIGDLSSIHAQSVSESDGESVVQINFKQKKTKQQAAVVQPKAAKSGKATGGNSPLKQPNAKKVPSAAEVVAKKRKLFNPDCEGTLSDLEETATSTYELTPRAEGQQRTARLLTKLTLNNSGQKKRQRNVANAAADPKKDGAGEAHRKLLIDSDQSSPSKKRSKQAKQPVSGPATAAGRRRLARADAEADNADSDDDGDKNNAPAAESQRQKQISSDDDDDEDEDDDDYGSRAARRRAAANAKAAVRGKRAASSRGTKIGR